MGLRFGIVQAAVRLVACVCIAMAFVLVSPRGMILGEVPAQGERLLGIYPECRPVVLRGTRANAFAAFSDGSKFICANGYTAELWDLTTAQRVLEMKHPEMVVGVAISPDETSLLTITAGRTAPVQLWSLEDGRMLREYASPFRDIVPNARQGQGDYWEFPRMSYLPKTGLGFTSVAFCPSGKTFSAGCEDGRLIVWNTNSGEVVARMTGKSQRLWSMAMSVDGKRILTSSANHAVQLWNVQTKAVAREYCHEKEHNAMRGYRIPVAFSSDGRRFAFCVRRTRTATDVAGSLIRICDARTGEDIRLLKERMVPGGGVFSVTQNGCVVFFPRSRMLTNTGSILEIWDLDRGNVTHRHTCESAVNPYYAYPSVAYVTYLPSISSAMAVEVENDENTLHETWTTISVVPLSEFLDVSRAHGPKP